MVEDTYRDKHSSLIQYEKFYSIGLALLVRVENFATFKHASLLREKGRSLRRVVPATNLVKFGKFSKKPGSVDNNQC
jgi:hypothetical protein